ncbi:MAG: amidohydrolase family protein [Chloroflexi bacterium]|nr:amidohydrolase family protein [Chloroflexota bacterium]OJV89163.1 MAG: amidohydrolase [Chloroflexi bacterium 54-19]
MTSERERVDYLFTGGTIVTMDEERRLVENGAIAVRGQDIVGVGPADELQARYEAGETVDCTGKAIMPGFINSHTHAPMTLLRGLADDLRLDVWLMGYMIPVEREFVSPEFVRLGTKLACAEMIKGGTTCFADMYYFEHDIAEATAEAGMRGVLAQSVMKFPTPDAGSYEDGLAASREFIRRWKDHPLIVPAVGPHAPYTCPPEILKACSALAQEFDVPLHIHIAETALEVENSRKENGMPVVPWVKRQNILDAKVIAAHCVHIDEGEIRTLQHAGAGIAHNPTSNLKLASGVAPVPLMLQLGANVGIGTDGAASNNDLDMFEETRLAAILAKGSSGDPTALPAREALALATIGGAKALHISDITGSLEPGKRADFIVVDLRPLHNTPRFNREPDAIYSQLVYVSKAHDVQHVLCNGKWLLRDRELLTLDPQELSRQAEEVAVQIDRFLVAREGNVVRKLLALGGLHQEESFEVQVKAQIDDPARVREILRDSSLFTITRSSDYRQYDTYFAFGDQHVEQLRLREDIYLDEEGRPTPRSRFRLTLIGAASEREFPRSVILNRSRFTATPDQSLRFYREYLNPAEEHEIVKLRHRNRFIFKDTEFALNMDEMITPRQPGYFLEIKSRTWSKRDAEKKAELIAEILDLLGISDDRLIREGYSELVAH